MSTDQLYRELSGKVGLPNSESLHDVWRMLCTEDEARVANLLPGTAGEIAARAGMDAGDVEALLVSLFKKGAAFRAVKDGVTRYRMAKNIVQFHDACILWEGATPEFFGAWKRVMDEDFAGFLKNLPEAMVLPSFMRVIPVNESVESRNEVLSFEECERLIEGSPSVAVVKCPCRLSQQNCAAPVENCIQINRGAEYVVDRGHGREITKEEALEIIRRSREAGLVQMTENRLAGNAICNCCSCCCEMFRLVEHTGKQWILSPSRYLAKVDEGCTACGACEEICPVRAIVVDGAAAVNAETCMGCGLCATVCPVEVITLGIVRPEEHIPR